MIRIVILDDNEDARRAIVSALDRFSAEQGVDLTYEQYSDPVLFLTDYRPRYDLVFLDIQMPDLDGMSVSRKIREADDRIPIVFITNMASMAVQGYSVDALDFIVKPIRYGAFEAMMKRAVRRLAAAERNLLLKTPDGLVRLRLEDIFYLEVQDHRVIYHTAEKDLETWSSLKSECARLPEDTFAQCSNYVAVNLKHVQDVQGNELQIMGKWLPISRAKKKAFLERLLRCYGGKTN